MSKFTGFKKVKKLYLILIILMGSYCARSQSNWFIQPISISSDFLWGVKMISTDIVFISASSGTIFKTTNGGSNWLRTTLPGTGDLFTIDFPSQNTGYTAGSQGRIFKTTNAGLNWNQVTSSTTMGILSSYFYNESTGFIAGGAANDGEIFKTTNGGINWIEYGTGSNFSQVVSMSFPSANTGYVVGVNGLILKSTNSGINWSHQQSGLGNVTFFSVYFINEITGYAVTPLPGTIIKTTNGGTSWHTIYNDTNHFLVIINFPTADTGFAVGGAIQQNIVMKTTNGGLNWNAEYLNFNGHLNSIDFINPSTGYITGDQGRLYKTTNGGTPINIHSNFTEVPTDFKLYQNFPNPFNPETTIPFYLDERSLAQINIYNILGQKIQTILNDIMPQGFYTVKWNAENRSSGIYFYELVISSHQNQSLEKRTMLYLK